MVYHTVDTISIGADLTPHLTVEASLALGSGEFVSVLPSFLLAAVSYLPYSTAYVERYIAEHEASVTQASVMGNAFANMAEPQRSQGGVLRRPCA